MPIAKAAVGSTTRPTAGGSNKTPDPNLLLNLMRPNRLRSLQLRNLLLRFLNQTSDVAGAIDTAALERGAARMLQLAENGDNDRTGGRDKNCNSASFHN